MRKVLLLITLILSLCAISAQQYHDFGFKRDLNITFLNQTSDTLKFALAGGFNSVRFSEIDVNGDGIKDLFAFEKNGNRILIFINNGEKNCINYKYAPEYAHFFPKMHDWVILKDYNQDGKEDIFTYGNAGITVYKNVSDEQGLRFELVTEQLESFYYNGYVNIYSSPDDYMAIEDIDGDGDLDILNFMVLGQYVHYQRNYAVENGDIEKFDFRLEDECWGHFAEGDDDNSIMLDKYCYSKKENNEPLRHTGSSILAYDFNGNGLKDIILGDVDYPQLILLENGGTLQEAHIVSQTDMFPNAEKPVWLYSMPAANFIDVNNDGKQDLIVSPSDPSLTKSQNTNSVWLYTYNSLSGQYKFVTPTFLQEEMVDVGGGSYPIFFDWDNDGLQDLFIANYGIYDSSSFENYFLTSHYKSSIAYYKNIGTAQNPSFQYVTSDFGNLQSINELALYPTFGDFNGDGLTDMLCGTANSGLKLLLNQGDGTFSAPLPYLEDFTLQYATPQLFDLDKDGKKDLLVGNRKGTISYYKNISSNQTPDFQFITDNLGDVDVRDHDISYFGYSVPFFFKDKNDETKLFCGNEQGKIFYFKNIDNNLDGTFELVEDEMFEIIENNRYGIREGWRIGLCLSDINNDGYIDMMVGNYAGGISFFKGCEAPVITIHTQEQTNDTFLLYPNPTSGKFSIKSNLLSENPVTYIIYSIDGKKIQEEYSRNPQVNFDLSNYNKGIYILKIFSDEKITTKKIVISD